MGKIYFFSKMFMFFSAVPLLKYLIYFATNPLASVALNASRQFAIVALLCCMACADDLMSQNELWKKTSCGRLTAVSFVGCVAVVFLSNFHKNFHLQYSNSELLF